MSQANDNAQKLRESGWTGWIDNKGNPVPDLDKWIKEQGVDPSTGKPVGRS